jgi:hypothetical protein
MLDRTKKIKSYMIKAEGQDETLASKRQIRVIMSTEDPDREGEIVVQRGINFDTFRSNPVVLWGHDTRQPIAKCIEVGFVNGKAMALVQFPDIGVSTKSDEVYGLIMAGIINCVSMGFAPVEAVPMNAKAKKGPQKYTKSNLLELSFCSVPVNPGALVVERAHDNEGKMKYFLKATRPVSETELERVVKQFNASIDGDGVVIVPEGFSLVTPAEDTTPDKALGGGKPVVKEFVTAMGDGSVVKGLYTVGSLARVLAELGYIKDDAVWEAEHEADDSAVPQMLRDSLASLGSALVAMTVEEVNELLATNKPKAGEAPLVKAMLDGYAGNAAAYAAPEAKGGRVLSKANEDILREASKGIKECRNKIKGVLAKLDPPDDTTATQSTGEVVSQDGQSKSMTVRNREADLLALSGDQ